MKFTKKQYTVVDILVWMVQQTIMFLYVAMGFAAMMMVVSISEGNIQYIVPLLIIIGIFYATYRYAVQLEKADEKEDANH